MAGKRCLMLWLVRFQLPLLVVGFSQYTKLKAIQTDSGTWDQPFAPDHASYKVLLDAKAMSVSVACTVDFARYASAKQWPEIRFNSTKIVYANAQPAFHTYALPATPYGFQLLVNINAGDPQDPSSKTAYQVQFSRPPNYQQLLALTQLKITDKQGHALVSQPPFIPSVSPAAKYNVYVSPNTRQVTLTAACDPRASTFVGESVAGVGIPIVVPMDSRSTRTDIRVSCSYMKRSSAFTVEFRQHVQLDTVMLSLHVLGDAGVVSQPITSSFAVAAKQRTVVVVPIYNDTRVGLDLVTKDGTKIPLGVGIPTPRLEVPDNGTIAMDLVMHNRGKSRHFGLLLRRYVPQIQTTPPPSRTPNVCAMRWGYIVAAIVAACIATVELIRGVCEAFGLGTPRFASPSLRSLTLLLQFVALSSVLLEPCMLTDFASPLRWLAVFPPPDAFWRFLAGENASWLQRASGIHNDSTEAAISLSCSSAAMGVLLVLHVLVLARFLIGGCPCRRYTLPHRLTLGGWESRLLLLIAYPVSCASVLLLMTVAQTPPAFGSAVIWSVSAVCAMTVLVTVTLAAECAVRHALSGRLVTWVFEGGRHSGAAEDAEREHDETGYFCDATCDQLGTVPGERSCCAAFVSHRWGTTVADIQPIELQQTLTERNAPARLLAAKDDLEDVAAEADSMAEVEVVATLRPGALCQPFYSEVGRFINVPWLQAQLDAPSLLRLHQEVDSKLHAFATPLGVSVSQLQGPVTCGWLSFCFDGLHWPHLPPLELIARILLGGLTAIATASPSYRVPALFASSFLAGTLFIFIFFHTPCITIAENSLLLLAYLGLAFVAFEFSAYAAGVFSLQVCSWAITISIALVGLPLLAYAVLASLSLFVAAACPRVSEEELDSHHTNNVDLALRGPHDAWLLLVPAACSVPVSDAFVHTREEPGGSAHIFVTENVGKGRGARPRLEFPVLDYLAPSEKLEVPRVVLIGPSQGGAEALGGHRSETIYGDEDPKFILADFLRRSSLPAEHSQGLTREVLDLLRKRAIPDHILVVDFMEPPRARLCNYEDDVDENASGSDEERETLMGTNRTNTNRVQDLRKVAIDDD